MSQADICQNWILLFDAIIPAYRSVIYAYANASGFRLQALVVFVLGCCCELEERNRSDLFIMARKLSAQSENILFAIHSKDQSYLSIRGQPEKS
jgi:hypothetical protein